MKVLPSEHCYYAEETEIRSSNASMRLVFPCFRLIKFQILILTLATFSPFTFASVQWGPLSYRINCGGPAFVDSDNRSWSSDDGTTGSYARGGIPVLAPPNYLRVLESISSTVADADRQLFYTSRIFPNSPIASQNSSLGYIFPVDASGRYFLRLYFLGISLSSSTELSVSVNGETVYPGKLSLSVNQYQLLSNFTPKGRDDFSNREFIPDFGVMREFLLPVLGTSQISIEIVPMQQYALLSGIELFNTVGVSGTFASPGSAPPGSPSPIVSSIYAETISNSIGLALLHRINCGGPRVSASEDFLGRSWQEDYGYDAQSYPTQASSPVIMPNSSVNLAPRVIYEAVRIAEYNNWSAGNAEIVYNLSVIPEEKYFLRFHFIDYLLNSSLSSSTVFGEESPEPQHAIIDLLLNYNPVLWSVNVLSEASGSMRPLFKDLIVTVEFPNLILHVIPSLTSQSNFGVSIAAIEIYKLLPEMSQLPQSTKSMSTTTSPVPGPSSISQGEILLQFKDSLANSSALADWIGEPCTNNLIWSGVGCLGGIVSSLVLSNLGLVGNVDPVLAHLTTLSNLWLDGNRFSGALPPELGKLIQLQTLRLNNNSFSGQIPVSFGELINIFQLSMSNNQMSGAVPKEILNLPLISNSSNASTFGLFTPGNDLCAPTSASKDFNLTSCLAESQIKPKKKSSNRILLISVIVGGVGGALLLILSILFGYFIGVYRRRAEVREEGELLELENKRKSGGPNADDKESSNAKENHSLQISVLGLSAGRIFNLCEIKRATKDFSDRLILGSGGFGKVYHGHLTDGQPVAVKRHVRGSGQGSQQFFVELEILSKVRHRHLVALMGYCLEKNEMILVYEFMPLGTLRDHLCRTTGGLMLDKPDVLSWRLRLEIAIGAAKGVDYLHHGLSPPIIHRDVKSTNILLDSTFSAKVGDFGLSRSGPVKDETHVSTAVKGSFGYVDPEYYKWLKLTEKSDVYSFGVVLLELIAGRKVIDLTLPYEDNQVNLVEWARPYLENRMVVKIVDKHLKNSYSQTSVERVADLVLLCLQEPGNLRPTMSEVIRVLEEALKLETTPCSPIPKL